MLKTIDGIGRGAGADASAALAAVDRSRPEGFAGVQGRRRQRGSVHAVHDLRRRERQREGWRRDAHRQGDDAVQARATSRSGSPRSTACVTVRDQITVLPVSQFDDELRYRIARSIYGNSNFWNYAIMAEPADPHRRRTRARDADRRGAQQRRPDAGAIAGHPVRRVVGDERAEDRRGSARAA